ncbi:DeoR/GlpR family DNA-binding transcription regulator [Aerococcus urinae]|uniref:DeoR/GlpR family DNA-binding transcription regulator n=1 Tax=Aerococcus urinae TaxID=1376 RepID=A0A0X8FFM1_9LACT|nr:DeoR/GlpR family DNA-binding transcription regulator [Aerococcus urinae]AMB96448.1 hypothetical protein AWM73_08010 [Aerococcus urinae]MCY3032179.1 DeoR/GlpR family DNA-binding transcription regulator [Aerococcus urinae]MCY3037685.1 DeoR/GlpR family DNA-binding transcription regulator [Aerococcus urinae]MCY3044225.1 DeoR/GlpR family DNA-binding transcription regulator [Aerococcus urinae]MCY3045650.1 DeoR/GlpR family DNA-binding transcription regulator [Aerococcus urinae]
MHKIERQQIIVNLISTEGKVTIVDLSKRFQVSEDTVRRDLQELEKQNMLKRIRAGAIRIGPPVTSFDFRKKFKTDEKIEISKKLVKNIPQNKTILIDGSTSNLELTKLFPNNFSATFITNSPPVACELSRLESSEIITLGGELYKNSMINIGSITYKEIKNIHADIYIMGIYNIDSSIGTSVPTLEEATIKEAMSSQSDSIFSIVTNDKFETISNFIINLDNSSFNIYSQNVSNDLIEKYRENGITIYQ